MNRAGTLIRPVALLLLIAAGSARAQQPDPLEVLEQAVANTRSMLLGQQPFEAVYLQRVASDSGDEQQSRVFRIDTRKPWEEAMELIEVDGRPADPEAREKFRAERLERIEEARAAEEDKNDPDQQDESTTISLTDLDTREARSIERQPGRLRFALPHGAAAMAKGAGAKMARHLTMEVSVVTEGHDAPWIDQMKAFNEKPFKPGLIGKIKQFQLAIDFEFNENPRLLLMTAMNLAIEARVFFRKIESRQRVAYTDHRFFAVEGGEGNSAAAAGDP